MWTELLENIMYFKVDQHVYYYSISKLHKIYNLTK